MSVLTPWFLAGLGLLSVPVIIHLTQRQRSEVTAFPSLMFLRKVPFKTSNRRRIRHPLLFALRCLAILLLALAFTRPFVQREGAAATDQARDVVVLIDASASLRYADRWDAALSRARDVIGGLVEGDRAAVVTFTERAEEHAALSADLVAAAAALDRIAPTDLGTRIDAGLQLAGRILSESDRTHREVVLISDFQRTGWEDQGRVRLPDGVGLRTESVADVQAGNVAVTGASFHASAEGRTRVLARVANMGSEAVPQVPVSLQLSGRTVATIPVDLAARGATTVTFEDVALPDGRTRGEVSVAADALEIDDALRFMTERDAGLEVLLLEGSRGRQDRSLFLEQALSIGEAPRLRAVRRPAGQLDGAWLATASSVFLNDGDLSDAGRAGRLRDWVRAGGALVVVLGPNANPSGWSDAGSELLGGTVRPLVDRTSAGGSRLAWLDYDHPVFEIFSTPRSGDFSQARFFRFHGFDPAPGTRVIARYEGGEPALVERPLGEGRVLVWTSTLDRFWNDLALQPVFLPFVHKLVIHGTGYQEPRRWLGSGDVVELATLVPGAEDPESEWVLVTPAGDRRPIERGEGPTWVEFVETGFYRIEPLEGEGEVTVAVNAPVAESDLTPVATEAVVDAVLGAGATGGEEVAAAEAIEAEPARAELWWPLVLLAALVLVTESVLANRWTRRRVTSKLAEAG